MCEEGPRCPRARRVLQRRATHGQGDVPRPSCHFLGKVGNLANPTSSVAACPHGFSHTRPARPYVRSRPPARPRARPPARSRHPPARACPIACAAARARARPAARTHPQAAAQVCFGTTPTPWGRRHSNLTHTACIFSAPPDILGLAHPRPCPHTRCEGEMVIWRAARPPRVRKTRCTV